MVRHIIFAATLALAGGWKLCRVDWIVKCRYAYSDFHPPPSVSYGVEYFRPPQSSAWEPPTPAKLTGRPESKWTDWEFFEGGGSWGPVEEPHLHVNWPLMFGKLGVISLISGCLIYQWPRKRGRTLP